MARLWPFFKIFSSYSPYSLETHLLIPNGRVEWVGSGSARIRGLIIFWSHWAGRNQKDKLAGKQAGHAQSFWRQEWTINNHHLSRITIPIERCFLTQTLNLWICCRLRLEICKILKKTRTHWNARERTRKKSNEKSNHRQNMKPQILKK